MRRICIWAGVSLALYLSVGAHAAPTDSVPSRADYAAAERYRELFSLGGSMGRGSMDVYANELPGTDDFWFDFTTSTGRHYYYVRPREARKEPLFDNSEMAARLSELTREVVDAARLDLSDIKFSADRRTFTFRYEGKTYEYDRRTHGLNHFHGR